VGTEAIQDIAIIKKINLKTKTIMQHINIKKFALAWGVAGVVLYLGCIILMATVGHEGTILFFNSLLHGLDTSTIIRMDVPWTEALIGLVEMFILGWLFGALIAAVYNISFNKKHQ
jgi:ABC-type antimicrobial peptide transport system permease subunit